MLLKPFQSHVRISMAPSRPPFPSGWSSIPITPTNLTLANTLPVGQSFQWHRKPLPEAGPSQPVEEFSRALHSPCRIVCLRQSDTDLYYTAVHDTHDATALDRSTGLTKRWLIDYFHLDRYPDLEEMYTDWRLRDPGSFGRTELDKRAIGVRLLRQDPWECLLA
jgi:N-glycosylase/DNA lyase